MRAAHGATEDLLGLTCASPSTTGSSNLPHRKFRKSHELFAVCLSTPDMCASPVTSDRCDSARLHALPPVRSVMLLMSKSALWAFSTLDKLYVAALINACIIDVALVGAGDASNAAGHQKYKCALPLQASAQECS